MELHQDIEVLLSQAQNDIPLFLIGHGFGAGLLLSFLLRNPNLRVSGVITMAALIKRHKVESCSCLTRLILDEFSNEFDVNRFVVLIKKLFFLSMSASTRPLILPLCPGIIIILGNT